MLLRVKLDKRPAAIVGYGPGVDGEPKAIVVVEGVLRAVALSAIELDDDRLPRKLRHIRGAKIVKLTKDAK